MFHVRPSFISDQLMNMVFTVNLVSESVCQRSSIEHTTRDAGLTDLKWGVDKMHCVLFSLWIVIINSCCCF